MSVIREAAAMIRDGLVVAYPTDTLYGLAVDPRNAEAVRRLYELKGRAETSALTLIAADAGQAQAAVDRLYTVVTGAWDARFADVDLIALTELNAVVDKSRRDGRAIDVGAIDKRLLKSMPLDVRVVLAWDADNTDVDLHVIDANGEEVYYGRNLSYQGGAITRDATGGYGPEEFALKIAKPGKYRVVANFFGHRQQVLTTGTGLMLWFSSGHGTAAQQDRGTTVRVKSERGERVAVGEFEVVAKP